MWLACRTIGASEKLILEIRKSGINSGRAKAYKLDNSSLNSVREFAKQIKMDYDKIHVLINNGMLIAQCSMDTRATEKKNNFFANIEGKLLKYY